MSLCNNQWKRRSGRRRISSEQSECFCSAHPTGPAEMKQPYDRAAFRIKSTQVRILCEFAMVADESEVFAVKSQTGVSVCGSQ